MLFWNSGRMFTCFLFQDSNLAVPADELYWNFQGEQACKRFGRHGSRQDIASDDYLIYSQLTNLCKHCFQSR